MTTTTFSLAGILSLSQEGNIFHYEHPLRGIPGTQITFTATGCLINKTLAFIKVMEQLIHIAEVNTSMGFFVADEAIAIDISPNDVIKILTNCVYKQFLMEDNYYEFVKKELTRLSSRRGRKAIRRECKGGSGRSLKLELAESPVLQFITSFLATMWHHILNDTLPEVEMAFGAPVSVNPHPIRSHITTQPNPLNPDYTCINILTGKEGEPLPDKLFTQDVKVVQPKKQNKKKRRRRK